MNTQANKKTKPVAALAVGMLISMAGAGLFIVMAGQPSGAVDPSAARPVIREPASPAPTPAAPAQQPIEPASPTPIIAEPTSADEPASPPRVDKASRLARDLEREKIWATLRRDHDLQPPAPGSPAPSEDELAKLPELQPEYVRESIRDQLMPVALDCYNSVLRQDPAAQGQVTVTFTIIADKEIGGVVESAEIVADETTFDNQFLRDCMRESMMAVTFDAPPDSGRREVTYPFMFEPE